MFFKKWPPGQENVEETYQSEQDHESDLQQAREKGPPDSTLSTDISCTRVIIYKTTFPPKLEKGYSHP